MRKQFFASNLLEDAGLTFARTTNRDEDGATETYTFRSLATGRECGSVTFGDGEVDVDVERGQDSSELKNLAEEIRDSAPWAAQIIDVGGGWRAYESISDYEQDMQQL